MFTWQSYTNTTSASSLYICSLPFSHRMYGYLLPTAWKDAGYQNQEEHTNFKNLLEAPQNDAQIIMNNRFPIPRFIVCININPRHVSWSPCWILVLHTIVMMQQEDKPYSRMMWVWESLQSICVNWVYSHKMKSWIWICSESLALDTVVVLTTLAEWR